VKIVSVPANVSRSSSSAGPAPTTASRASGMRRRTSRTRPTFFSVPSRPTYSSSGRLGSPPLSIARISPLSSLNFGLKTSVSIPFRHTSRLRTPMPSSCSFSCGDVQRQRSAQLSTVGSTTAVSPRASWLSTGHGT
jgi:hypothetical protein